MHAVEVTMILLAASIGMVTLLRRFGLPALVGYLAVGILVGPYAGDLAGDSELVSTLAELGVVFLMFSLGLEFNLEKLIALRGFVFGLGPLQVGTTIVVVVAVCMAIPARWLEALLSGPVDWRTAVVLGGAVAMSSTALVSKMLTEARELETDHGRRVFGILLFQDLALIPLLILTPALAGGPEGGDWEVTMLWAAGKAVVLVVALLNLGPPVMRAWFLVVARMRSHEIFTLNVLLAALFFAWVTEQSGLSMELGAFVAGMLIAETDYRLQVEEDIKPFRDLLLGLFFITIGMKLDVAVVVSAWPQVLLLLTLPIVLKFGLVALLVRVCGGDAATAIKSGLWLAQAGEFGFVLLVLATQNGLLPQAGIQPVLAAMLLSILLSPLLIRQADRISLRASGDAWLRRAMQIQQVASQAIAREGHVILCGYGRCGQSLAHVLETEGVQFVALDLDPDRIRQAKSVAESVVFGDATRRETLIAAGVHRAAALVVTTADTPSTLRLLAVVRKLAPNLPVLVRTDTDTDFEALRQAGATEVVPEVSEGSLMLALHALAIVGLSLARVEARARSVREGRYALLRGHFHGRDDAPREAIETTHVRLHPVTVGAGVAADGRPLAEVALGGCRLVAVVRDGIRFPEPSPTLQVRAGDTLVLAGSPEQLRAGEAILTRA